MDSVDYCPDTVLPDLPTVKRAGARFAAQTGGAFDSASGKLDGWYSLQDTRGCSTTQSSRSTNLGSGRTKFGITQGALNSFISRLPALG